MSKQDDNRPRTPLGDAAETRLRLEGIVASAMDAIITVDNDQGIVLFNPAAERMFGLSAEAAMGEPITRFIPERYRSSHGDHIRRFAETGVTSRQMGSLGAISGRRENGEEFPIEASISQVEIGGERLSTVILRDITERKRAEGALEESRRRMEGIVNSAMDALITIDNQQRILLFNPAAERMFEVSASEALGEPISRFIPERFRAGHDEHIKRFKATGVTDRRMGALGAISGLRASGEEFPVEASISQTEVAGELLATVILRDITERRANEEARLLLAREVDHRAKNALAVVQALVSLTRAPTKEEFVVAVRGRVAALARAHTLLSRNRWEGADLARVITDETEAYRRPGQVRIDGPPVSLAPDAVQPISLLVHELATNAVKYGALSVEQGRVEVAWRTTPDHELELTWVEAGGPAVSVPVGKGFGSTLVSEVTTRQLGGRMDVDWNANGMSLRVLLPARNYRAALSHIRRSTSDTAVDGPAGDQNDGGLILIVEDEVLVAMELTDGLRQLGWEVLGPAASTDEALTLLARSRQPDAAILDINLAGKLVFPLAELLRARRIPFVFCTGYEEVGGDERYRDTPVVRKPVNLNMLGSELRKVMAEAA
ncbi:MAG: PAS domain S-box protein [Caulobacterales bacterium]|nr:PAS domain S-box protein [Caulobacterales bacterium]